MISKINWVIDFPVKVSVSKSLEKCQNGMFMNMMSTIFKKNKKFVEFQADFIYLL